MCPGLFQDILATLGLFQTRRVEAGRYSLSFGQMSEWSTKECCLLDQHAAWHCVVCMNHDTLQSLVCNRLPPSSMLPRTTSSSARCAALRVPLAANGLAKVPLSISSFSAPMLSFWGLFFLGLREEYVQACTQGTSKFMLAHGRTG